MRDKEKMKKVVSSSKMLKLVSAVALISSMLFTTLTHAQSIARVGSTAAPFLKIGVGGRALGMGEAYTTLAEDITGMYWNPAGAAQISKMQLLVNHYDYIADLYFDYGAFAIPIENLGTLGAFIGHLGMPDIDRTTIASPNGTGEKVSASSIVIGLSYSRALTDRFSIGGNVKYISESIWHSSATTFAFDVGVLYRTFFNNIRLGMSISNFGSDMQMTGRDMLVQHDINQSFAGNNENLNAYLDTDKFPLPIVFRFGISANIAEDFLNLAEHDWIISIDAVHPNDNKEFINLGTEVKLYDMISLRTGFRQLLLEEREGGLTFGFGVDLSVMNVNLKLDYANVDYGRLDHQNKFSLIFSF